VPELLASPLMKKSNDFTDDIEVGSIEDYSYGSILGAFTGDACGSYNEFCTFIQTDDKFMDDCMKMPGGGPFHLASG